MKNKKMFTKEEAIQAVKDYQKRVNVDKALEVLTSFFAEQISKGARKRMTYDKASKNNMIHSFEEAKQDTIICLLHQVDKVDVNNPMCLSYLYRVGFYSQYIKKVDEMTSENISPVFDEVDNSNSRDDNMFYANILGYFSGTEKDVIKLMMDGESDNYIIKTLSISREDYNKLRGRVRPLIISILNNNK